MFAIFLSENKSKTAKIATHVEIGGKARASQKAANQLDFLSVYGYLLLSVLDHIYFWTFFGNFWPIFKNVFGKISFFNDFVKIATHGYFYHNPSPNDQKHVRQDNHGH